MFEPVSSNPSTSTFTFLNPKVNASSNALTKFSAVEPFDTLLSSIKCIFQWKYLSFYYFIILLSLVLFFYEYQNLNILSYLTLFFLIINFKNIIKNYLNRELKESI